jgi:hypothetical protein
LGTDGVPHAARYLSLLYKYVLHFDSLVTLTDTSPAPFGHDETVKAACRAQAEKDVHDALGLDWQYYRETALPNSVSGRFVVGPEHARLLPTPPVTKRNWRDQFPRPTVIFNQ